MNYQFNINLLMRKTKKEIDNAGNNLINNPSDIDSFRLLNEWRALHALPLIKL